MRGKKVRQSIFSIAIGNLMAGFDEQVSAADNFGKIKLVTEAIETTWGAMAALMRELLLPEDGFLELTISSVTNLAGKNGWELK